MSDHLERLMEAIRIYNMEGHIEKAVREHYGSVAYLRGAKRRQTFNGYWVPAMFVFMSEDETMFLVAYFRKTYHPNGIGISGNDPIVRTESKSELLDTLNQYETRFITEFTPLSVISE